MDIVNIFTLSGIMVLLALMPSTSVALVVTRTITSGFSNGIAVSFGIVMGDLIFIVLVLFGLSVVAETMSWLFITIKYLGACYLIWFGYKLLAKKSSAALAMTNTNKKTTLLASFFAGLFLTLGDVKAIFFYMSFFPIVVNVETLKLTDIFSIILITILSVGGVKIIYACLAGKIASLSMGLKLQSKARKTLGSFMIGAGGYLLVKT